MPPLVAIVSENVAAVAYDPPSRTMRVQFRSGGIYDYRGVSADLYQQMLLPHPWRRVGKRVLAHPVSRVR